MARTFSTTKQLSALVLDRISIAATCRRGYAAAEGAVCRGRKVNNNGTSKTENEESEKATSFWYPDPVTGYYRPQGQSDEMDAAELRLMFLKSTVRRE